MSKIEGVKSKKTRREGVFCFLVLDGFRTEFCGAKFEFFLYLILYATISARIVGVRPYGL